MLSLYKREVSLKNRHKNKQEVENTRVLVPMANTVEHFQPCLLHLSPLEGMNRFFFFFSF